ncbi:MAG: HAD hydrolase-like protein [Rhabdochlamydiaceae bacterium]|nr:HAD hydrolase-like protein [Candidatus Amphrikana amoebophyrae]
MLKLLIIFDLDDTLVKTTESIIPSKLDMSFKKSLSTSPALLPQLMRLDSMALSSDAAIDEFGEINELDQGVICDIKTHMQDGDLEGIDVECSESANEVLKILSQDHNLCLVSRGLDSNQRAKIKKSGIETAYFSEIIFCQKDKCADYEMLAKKYSDHPLDVIVCGDRVALDLSPAKALGYHTVQMCQGRGSTSFDYFADVDVKIIQLVELFDIILNIERKKFLRKL